MRGTGAILALVLLVLPTSASAASNPTKLAKRLVEAPDLRGAVTATEDILAAGGISTAVNGQAKRRAKVPAPVVVSGTEVLHMAYEARDREAAGNTTLAELATGLTKAGFPFAKPKKAPAALKQLLAVWVKAAKRRKGDARNFGPLFLAAMAKHQSRPLDLAKPNYDPNLLRLSQLEVMLFAAAFQRGPERFWTSESRRRGARPAANADAACSFAREWQKKQLEELYGKKVAEDLDAVLDHGYKMLLGRASGAIETVLEAGIEKNLLAATVQEKKAAEWAAKGAKSAMIALNVALKMYKLSLLYGSVQTRVISIPEGSVHQADVSRIRFAAFVGMTDEKVAEIEAEKQRLAGETEIVKALRDCLKMVDLPSLADPSEIAGELEKWRVRWKLYMPSSRAAPNIAESNFNGLFRHDLIRRTDYEAYTPNAVVTVKPEERRWHERCDAPIKHFQVTADANLDGSQGPGFSTAVDIATGNVLGVALEAAEQIFRATALPGGSATVNVGYHVRPPGASAAGADVCRSFPSPWTGTASGEFTQGDGITVSWAATFTEFVYDQEPGDYAFYNNWMNNNPETPVGSITWTMQGTDSQGCTVSGSGTTGIGLQLSLNLAFREYADRIAMLPGGSGGVTRNCPGPPPSHGETTGFPYGPWICSPSGPYTLDLTTLVGHDPAVDEFFYDKRTTGNCKWEYKVG